MYKQNKYMFDTYNGRKYNTNVALEKELQEKKMLMESNTILQREQLKKSYYKNNIIDASVKRGRRHALLEKMENYAKEKLFKHSLSSLYFNALPLDESFKEEYKNNILYLAEEKVNNMLDSNNKNIDILFEKISIKSDYLKSLVEACKSKAKKVAAKSVNKLNEDDDFDLDDMFEDDDDFDLDDIDEYDIEDITETIKEKVINVVKSENERSEKEEELRNEIVAAKSMNENVQIIKKNPIELYTLFKSIMTNNYKKILSETKEHGKDSVYAIVGDGGEIKVDIDFVLAESILVYTLMEMFYTIQIDDYDSKKISQLAESLAYQNVKK